MTWINRALAGGAVARRVVDEVVEPAEPSVGAPIAAVEAAPARGMLTLRGELESAAMVEAVRAATGFAVPAARRAEVEGESGVYWMSPDELLLSMPMAALPAAYAAATEALRGEHHLLVDVSDARQIFTVSGARAREVLAKGAPLDLHPMKFGLGDLRRTRLAQVAAMIALVATDPEEKFELFCFRSYAAYLQRFLMVSAAPGSEVDLFDTAR